MQEESDEDLTNKPEIYKDYPFLYSFPFDDYQMSLEKGKDYAAASGIDPIVISAAGGIAQPEFINFDYRGKYTQITISFYTYDIKYIHENSHKIIKLDSVREILDDGLDSDNLLDKIDIIKRGERFLKQLGSGLIAGKSFDPVLDEFLNNAGYIVDKPQLRKIKSMYKTLDETELENGVKDIVKAFYNIHLHHIKILLGIVIASKIH